METENFQVARDAFSSGQMGSKIWLCQVLEQMLLSRGVSAPQTVWVYGGWHGVLGFLLLSRQAPGVAIERVRSFDIDPAVETPANLLCENWVWREWMFRAFTADCNALKPGENHEYGPPPTIVINTSVEHFAENTWFENIPAGTIVALQAADFDHHGASAPIRSEAELRAAYPLAEEWFSGAMTFDYGSWSFQRFMAIGRKGACL